MDGQLLTLDQVAEYLCVHRDTVYKLVRSGRLRALQLGGRKAGWRVSDDDLKEFVDVSKSVLASGVRTSAEAELEAFDESQRKELQAFQDSQAERRVDFVGHQERL
jgi:excisionase family DNA binding protein